jgi:hypothetical protein
MGSHYVGKALIKRGEFGEAEMPRRDATRFMGEGEAIFARCEGCNMNFSDSSFEEGRQCLGWGIVH